MMMKQLIIKNFDKINIGIITQKEDGTLVVKGETPEFERELKEIVDKITSKPVFIGWGRTEEREGKKIDVDGERICKKGDPKYLNAIRDILWNYSIGGKRVYGIISEK